MELRRYLQVLRRRLPLIVATVVLAGVAAWAATPKSARYTARASIYVGARQLSLLPAGGVSSDALQGVERLIQTYAVMIHSTPVAEAAVERTGIQRSAETVLGETNATPRVGTQLLEVTVTDPNPGVAQQLTNAIADAFAEQVQTFEPSRAPSEGALPALPAYVFERAKLPLVPDATGLVRNIVLGVLFGFVAAAGLTFLLEYLDVTVKSSHEAERRLGLPVLGVVPLTRDAPASIGSGRDLTRRQSA